MENGTMQSRLSLNHDLLPLFIDAAYAEGCCILASGSLSRRGTPARNFARASHVDRSPLTGSAFLTSCPNPADPNNKSASNNRIPMIYPDIGGQGNRECPKTRPVLAKPMIQVTLWRAALCRCPFKQRKRRSVSLQCAGWILFAQAANRLLEKCRSPREPASWTTPKHPEKPAKPTFQNRFA